MPQNIMRALYAVIRPDYFNLFPTGLLLSQKLYIGFIKTKFTTTGKATTHVNSVAPVS